MLQQNAQTGHHRRKAKHTSNDVESAEGNDMRRPPSSAISSSSSFLPSFSEQEQHPRWPSPSKRGAFTLMGWLRWLWEPVDASSLAVFRILWGLVLTWEVLPYLAAGLAKAKQFFLVPHFSPKYYMFSWVEPCSEGTLWLLLWVLVGCAVVGVTLGLCYRVCSLVFLLGFGYLFWMDTTWYLNHFYLLLLLQFLLLFLPATSVYALDNVLLSSTARRKQRGTAEGTKTSFIPRWCLWLLRWQMVIVYAYAGVAKLNEDWLRGEPLRHWLTRPRRPVFHYLLETEWAPYFFSYAGAIFDLVVGFMLLLKGRSSNKNKRRSKRRRMEEWIKLMAVLMSVFFHLSNKMLFNIGIFPWMCIAATTLFFSADWTKNCWLTNLILRELLQLELLERQAIGLEETSPQYDEDNAEGQETEERNHGDEEEQRKEEEGGDMTQEQRKRWEKEQRIEELVRRSNSAVARFVRERDAHRQRLKDMRYRFRIDSRQQLSRKEWLILAACFVFLLVQIGLPLRHWFYPGDVAWNEYGHRFSWRMKLRDKQCNVTLWFAPREEAGLSQTQPHPQEANNIPPLYQNTTTTLSTRVAINLKKVLPPRQLYVLQSRPEDLHQLAYFLKQKLLKNGDLLLAWERHLLYRALEKEGKTLRDVEIGVYADVQCSLNFRPKQALIDSSYDLTAWPLWQWPYPFVQDLKPLPKELRVGHPWNWNWALLWRNYEREKEEEFPRGIPPFPLEEDQVFLAAKWL